MEAKKMTLPENSIVGRTGGRVCAVRTTSEEYWRNHYQTKDKVLTYKPAVRPEGMDQQMLVYEIMILVGYDMLELGNTPFGGTYSAAELAGCCNNAIRMFMDNCNGQYEEYGIVRIELPTFKLRFAASETFKIIAEWEGVAGITAKKAHRFACEGEAMPLGISLKPYSRKHCYKKKTVSMTIDNERVAKKFEKLALMEQGLTSEGMRKAYSLLEAVKLAKTDDVYGKIAEELMLRKLWKDYRRDEFKYPVDFSAEDFEYAPDVWKQVNKDYVRVLMDYFREVIAASPKPKWIKVGMFVQRKNQNFAPKKWQGKQKVCYVYAQINVNIDKIDWYANVCTTKGRRDNVNCSVEYLEPWEEPKKVKSEKGKEKKDKPKRAQKPKPSPEITLAERLRSALLKQFKEAA